MLIVNFEEGGFDGVAELGVLPGLLKDVVDDSGEDTAVLGWDFGVGGGAHGEGFAAAGLSIG